jgi:hypothetical protein
MTYTSGMVGRAALRTLPAALGSIAAVLVSFGAMDALCARLGVDPSPAILAAALSVGLMRNPERLGARALLTKIVVLPLIALAAGLVGLAIVVVPPLGAALFASSIALSIWLRNFGERATAVGRTIALPFIAILVAPLRPEIIRATWHSRKRGEFASGACAGRRSRRGRRVLPDSVSRIYARYTRERVALDFAMTQNNLDRDLRFDGFRNAKVIYRMIHVVACPDNHLG